MKVLHVGYIKPTIDAAEGINHSVRGYTAALRNIGLDIGLLSTRPLLFGEKMEVAHGITLLDPPVLKQSNPWLVRGDYIPRIRERFGEPDIVHFHSVYVPLHCALARQCKNMGWPYIITPHSAMTHLGQSVNRTKKRISNFLAFNSYIKNAAAIHALCDREAGEIKQLFNVKKIITVPNGVEDYLLSGADSLSPVELEGFRKEDDLVLCYVGRIDMHHKGLDLLLDALAILKAQYRGVKCKLLIVGPFRTAKNKRLFESMIESHGLRSIIKLVGSKFGDEKIRHFLAGDIFVHTSRFEGMPMAILEAMALGRSCMVTPGTNMLEVVCQGGGWQCEPNPVSIAETISDIYEKRDSLKSRGRKSHELMREQFTWRIMAERLNEEYTRLLQHNKLWQES